MASMYETIMNLPLFKGVSRDQVSIFLEKTHIDFSRYDDQELIASRDESVCSVMCVINGKVSLSHPVDNNGIVIKEELGKENIICADKLFGLSTTYGCEVRSSGTSGIMKFSKEQYIELLKSNPIYLINYLNFLSLKAQRPETVFRNFDFDNSLHRLVMQMIILTDREAERIEISDLDGKKHKVSEILESNMPFFNNLIKDGIVRISDNSIIVSSRNSFIERVIS